MRVMIDTNVLISALLWPDSRPALAVLHVSQHHHPLLCPQILDELHEVIARKAPTALNALDAFLDDFPYELAPAFAGYEHLISDPKDQPILVAAISNNADLIISGDKHFLLLRIDHPRIVSPGAYLDEFSRPAERLN
jgi:putative PIN family toxin of toxin-antitoxin system